MEHESEAISADSLSELNCEINKSLKRHKSYKVASASLSSSIINQRNTIRHYAIIVYTR